MNKKIAFTLTVVFLLGMVLTACNRPASELPSADPTQGFPFPVSQTQGVSQFATQTAAARQPVVVSATTAPGQPATTPVVVPTTAPSGTQQPPVIATEKPVTLPTLTRPDSYTIQQGEFPVCIARRYDLDLADFLAINGLTLTSRVPLGTTLKVPASGNWASNYGSRMLAAHPDTYTVLAGDSIGRIACLYGDVSPEGILAANGLTKASEIQAGQTLKIP